MQAESQFLPDSTPYAGGRPIFHHAKMLRRWVVAQAASKLLQGKPARSKRKRNEKAIICRSHCSALIMPPCAKMFIAPR